MAPSAARADCGLKGTSQSDSEVQEDWHKVLCRSRGVSEAMKIDLAVRASECQSEGGFTNGTRGYVPRKCQGERELTRFEAGVGIVWH